MKAVHAYRYTLVESDFRVGARARGNFNSCCTDCGVVAS